MSPTLSKLLRHLMMGLTRALPRVLLMTVMVGALFVWIGIPYLERRWTFFPAKSAVTDRRQMPADVVEVAFPTSYGLRLGGFFFNGAEPSNGVTVLVLHGRRGELIGYANEAQTLQALGFNVLLFYYRGFGSSEGTSLGERTLDLDGAAALRYLVQERGIDPQSIALLGISLGTAVAAHLAASSPCRAVALIGAFASAKEQAKRFRPWVPSLVLNFLSSPFDTLAMIEAANCPVLIIHGAKDVSAPLKEAQAIYDAAKAPKKLIVVPNAEHMMSDLVIDGFLGDLGAFFVNRQ
jgi:uncharacterized protein